MKQTDDPSPNNPPFMDLQKQDSTVVKKSGEAVPKQTQDQQQ